MAPKKAVVGLQRVNGEWLNWSSLPILLPTDWPIQEAVRSSEAWLGQEALLFAVRRMAILGDHSACRLLMMLEGQDIAKEAQIAALCQQSAQDAAGAGCASAERGRKAAMAARTAVEMARAFLNTQRKSQGAG